MAVWYDLAKRAFRADTPQELADFAHVHAEMLEREAPVALPARKRVPKSSKSRALTPERIRRVATAVEEAGIDLRRAIPAAQLEMLKRRTGQNTSYLANILAHLRREQGPPRPVRGR